jgi:adenine phosphoribosyltransferase
MCKLQALYKIKFKKNGFRKVYMIFKVSKEGILFKDITPLLIDPNAMPANTVDGKDKQIDKVIGVESRGFFGMLLAQELNVGFIPVRKPNKLPYETISASYDLEYGSDT